jgi:lantibiotic modifying enzyme
MFDFNNATKSTDFVQNLNKHLLTKEVQHLFSHEESNFYGMIYSLRGYLMSGLNTVIGKRQEFDSIWINYNSIKESFSDDIYSYLITNFLKNTLKAEKKLALEYLFLDETDIHYRFIELTNDFEWIQYFFQKYPVLEASINSFIETQMIFCDTLLKCITNDIIELREHFEFSGLLENIELYKGDLHCGNKSVCKLIFTDRNIYYKPRSFRNDQILMQLLQNEDLILKVPPFIEKNDYGYCKDIFNSQHDGLSQKKTEDYFYQLGKVIKFVTCNQLEDIIGENLVYSNGSLFLIDSESIFMPKIIDENNRFYKQSKLFELSVIGTSSIPSKIGIFEYDYSFVLPSKRSKSRNIKNDQELFNFIFKKEAIDTYLPDFYLIENEDEYITCIRRLIFGYKDYEVKIQLEAINQVDQNMTRIIVRDTSRYAQLIDYLFTPEFLIDKEVFLRQIAVLLPMEDEKLAEINRSEVDQILNLDIPMFYLSNGNLYNDKKELIIQNFYKKEDRLVGIHDHLFNEKILFSNLLMQLPDKNIFKNLLGSVSKLKLTEHNLIKSQVLNVILSNIHYNEVPLILNPIPDTNNLEFSKRFSATISLMKTGLYDGTDGLLLAILNAQKNNKSPESKQAIEQLSKLGYSIFKSSFNNIGFEDFGFFHSASASIISFIIYNEIYLNQNGDFLLDQFIQQLLKYLKKEENLNFSFVDGICSTLLFLLNNAHLFGGHVNSELEAQIKTTLSKFLSVTEEKSTDINTLLSKWNMRSENAGFLILLNALEKKNSSDSFISVKKAELTKQLMNDLEYILNNIQKSDINYSWYTGISGIISLLISVEDSKSSNLFTMFTDKLNFENMNGFGLSGGNLGPLIINEKLSDLNQSKANRSDNTVFEDLFHLNGDIYMKSMIYFGLYNGLSGFLVYNNDEGMEFLIPDNKWLLLDSSFFSRVFYTCAYL